MNTGFLTREKSFAYLSITSHMLPTSWDPESHLREGSCRQRGCGEQGAVSVPCIITELPAQGSTTPTAAALASRPLCLAKSPSPCCQPKLSVKSAEWLRLGNYENTGAVPP